MSETLMGNENETPLKRTPLDALHRAHGAKMVPFAGFDMPLQYAGGIIAEHRATRTGATLFDVSHMGQAAIRGDSPLAALEALAPGDLASLPVGGMRYTQLTNDHGGIVDDLMVTSVGEDYAFVVVNASRRDVDLALLRAGLPRLAVEELDRALIALQGPRAAEILAPVAPGAEKLRFMSAAPFMVDGSAIAISRSGYTGEDGFEISIPAQDAPRIAERLLAGGATLAGLGARDSLRLEAGLCLYGNDIDETTTPVEAGLGWSIGKRRREEGGFPGAEIVLAQLREGPVRRLVGLLPEGRQPVRAHAEIRNGRDERIGEITSGGFGPTVDGPVAMGYVASAFAGPDTAVTVILRDRPVPARVVKRPFVSHRYFKKT
jgi:aminomethyltransferase